MNYDYVVMQSKQRLYTIYCGQIKPSLYVVAFGLPG